MKALVYLGLAFAFVGLFVDKLGPRFGWGAEPHSLVMAEGDRANVDERTVLYLESFKIEKYPSGKISQYRSSVKIIDNVAHTLDAAEITVNHPLRVNGWWVYQFGYGPDQTDTMCTELKCVKDAGLPFAAIGAILLLLGTLGMAVGEWRKCRMTECSGVQSPRRSKTMTICNLVLLLVVLTLPVFIIGRAILRPEPVPALQSWLMAPHVAAYAVSYLILLSSAFGFLPRLTGAGFFLMTLGLVLGALWGKLAWSDWWQFDPKENWSFVTFLAFFVALHLRPDSRARKWALRVGAILIVITLTWVNFSRALSGLHSYA